MAASYSQDLRDRVIDAVAVEGMSRRAAAQGITLQALWERLAADRGVRADTSMLSPFFRREGISFKKKTLHASEQERPDVARRGAQWRKYQHRIDSRRLVFIDETWAKTNIIRTHGRSPRGRPLEHPDLPGRAVP